MENYDLIIIGAGPAGLAAAIYALERKLNLVVLESGLPGGQLVNYYHDKPVSDFPSYPEIMAEDLARKMTAHASNLGVKIQEDTPVSGIFPKESGFKVVAGVREFHTRSVLLATGMGHFRPRKLGVPGEEELLGKGIYYQKLPEKVTGKRVVVIGGGDTAIEAAVTVAEKGATTMIVHRRGSFSAQESTVARAKKLTVTMYMSAEVKAINGTDRIESVEIVKNSGGTTLLSADYVIVCIGVEMHKGFLEKLGIKIENQAVLVNGDFETSIPGIFACGDIIVPLGKYKRITIALGTAAQAINGVYQYLKK